MKDYDDELKDLFQNKNLENAFSPDEQNWTKMAAVLKNEQKVKRKFLLYLSSFVLLMGVVGTAYFIGAGKSTDTLAVTSQQTAENDNALNPNTVLPEPAAGAKKGPSELSEDAKLKQKQRINENTTISDKTQLIAQIKPNRMSDGKKVDEKKDIVEKKHSAQNEQVEAMAVGPKKNDALPVSSGEGILHAATPTKSIPLSNSIPVNTNPEVAGEEPLHEALLPETKEEKSQQNFQNLTQTKHSPQKEAPVSVLATAENQVKAPLKADVLAMADVALPLQKPDSLIKGAVSMVEILPARTFLSRRISMEIGTNYLFGWKTDNKREAAGFNPLVGLQYSHELNKNIALSLGVQYSSINHLSNTSHTSTTTRLKFGEEVDATVISALNMHYLYLPLKINYRFNRNNSVALGYTIAYLLDAESRVETYTTRLDYASKPVVSKSMGVYRRIESLRRSDESFVPKTIIQSMVCDW